MGTPDSLRLSRLDKLIADLGEHSLNIRQQGTSVTDLDDRVKDLERKMAEDVAALWHLREVDVHGELSAARTSIDKLAKQVTLLGRDQEEGRIQAEKRMQQVEARQAEVERQLAALAAQADSVAAEAAAAVEELRQATKGMLSEVIGRVADQFDALQAALEEAISGRAAEAAERSAAAAAVQEQLEEQRRWVQERAEGLQQQLEARLEASGLAGAAAAEEQQRLQERVAAVEAAQQREASELRSGLDAACQQLEEAQQQLSTAQQQAAAHSEQLEQQVGQLAALADRQQRAEAAALERGAAHRQQASDASAALQRQVAALEEQQAAAASRRAEAEAVLRQALTLWQHGVEEQFSGLEARLGSRIEAAVAAQEHLSGRFEEYKGYVKRLRREVAEVRSEQEASSAHIAAVRQNFGGARSKMDRVHAEAAALGGELLQATAAAAAAGNTLRAAAPPVM